jgi:hypothetical protein
MQREQEQSITLKVSKPLSLITATLDFTSQFMIARHPGVLDAPEEARKRRCPTPERAARNIIEAINNLYYAVEIYRAAFADDDNDDIPF